MKRVDVILKKGEIDLNNESKITWKNNPIARLKKGNNYLSPEIEIIADESLNEDAKFKLIKFLSNWLGRYISDVLGDLVLLSKHKITNQYLRGLVFQLYENNGVIKRSIVDKIVKSIPLEERKSYGVGIKIEYHIYLPKMLKPKAVEFQLIYGKYFIICLVKIQCQIRS